MAIEPNHKSQPQAHEPEAHEREAHEPIPKAGRYAQSRKRGHAPTSTLTISACILLLSISQTTLAQSPTQPAALSPASQPAETQPTTAPTQTQPTTSPTQTQPTSAPSTAPSTAPALQPVQLYDTTLARPICPRDWLEEHALERGPDLRLVDRLMDERTEPPPFCREPLPLYPPDARIAPDVPMLPDTDPFAPPTPLAHKEPTMHVGVARSTFHTREPAEVLAAAAPFIDLTQRDVAVRGAAVITETAGEIFYGLLQQRIQMQISNVFDYLLVQSWFANVPDNGTILLCWAAPAHSYPTELGRDLPGVPGTSIILVVDKNSPYRTPADLRNTRLALPHNYVNAPGAFLTRTLEDLEVPPEQQFFSKVTLRRFSKDAVIDVLKGHADVACVDEGTLAALADFYGINVRIRPVAVSPRYNLDVLFTSKNNLEDYRTEIELTQRQLTTLAKDPEGQEVLFFFDESGWFNYRRGDLAVPREHFGDFVRFLTQTPVDLKLMLAPNPPVDRQTYTIIGDE